MKTFSSAIILVQLIFETNSLEGATCGVDGTNTSRVYEGTAQIEHYPWMGMLFYKSGGKRFTTAVVLVSKQVVICSADEIDKLPKTDFRANSRVALGSKCGDRSVGVREYSFAPDYSRTSYSALAIVQLETDSEKELTPICPPPKYFIQPQIFALSFNNCKSGKIRIYEMTHVPNEECHTFYRKHDLDMANFWPEHTVCARALLKGRCVWHSGTVLAMKQAGHWRLLGFGIYGPGCESPSRFMDYNMHQNWVRTNINRAGYPAITRIGDNHLIMRRSLGNVQRFGPCDPEETQFELFTDLMSVDLTPDLENRLISSQNLSYNVTLVAAVDYSCIVLKANALKQFQTGKSMTEIRNPKIYLRRWCAAPPNICYGFQHADIHFFVEVTMHMTTDLSVSVYGKTAQILNPDVVVPLVNKISKKHVTFQHYVYIIGDIASKPISQYSRWFNLTDTIP